MRLKWKNQSAAAGTGVTLQSLPGSVTMKLRRKKGQSARWAYPARKAVGYWPGAALSFYLLRRNRSG